MTYFNTITYLKIFLLITLLFSFFYNSSNILAQKKNDIPKDSLQILDDKAWKFFGEEKYDEALAIFSSLQKEYLKNEDWENYLYQSKFASLAHHKLEQHQEAITLLKKTETNLDGKLGEKENLFNEIYNNLGALYVTIGNFKMADKYFQATLKIREKTDKDSLSLANTYQNIATLYQQTRDYQQALRYAQKARQIYKQNNATKEHIALNSNAIGGIYNAAKQYKNAIPYYSSAIEHISQKEKIKVYNALADNHTELAQYDSAYYYLQKAKKLDTKDTLIDLTYLNIGRYYRDKPTPNYQAALDTFQLSLQETIKAFGKNHSYVAIGNMHIGRTHFLQKNYEKALENYQKAINIFVPSFTDSTDFYKNPQKLIAEDKINLLTALQRKGEILQAKHKETKAKKDIETALETFQLAAALIDTIRMSYFAEESKFSLAEKALPIYENAIEAAITNNDFELAFEFSEKGKAIVLLEATQGRGAATLLPDSLVTQEYDTKKNITFYEKKIFEAKINNDTANLKDYESKLFENQRKLEDLKRLFKSDFPKYHSEKYNIKTVSTKDIREKILQQNIFEQFTQDKKALIEYFVGDSNIYIFTITANDIFIDKTEKTADFEQKIDDFRNILSEKDEFAVHENYKPFYEISTYLYQTLLEKPLLRIPKTKDLVIVPDAALLYLPFGALTQKMPNVFYLDNKEYDINLFVNNYYTISYNYSSTLLLSEKERNKKEMLSPKNNFLGFAPVTFANLSSSFDSEKKLDTLKFSRAEILFIDSLLNGMMYIENDASKKRFLELAEKAKIIHLSSHAFVSDSLPMQSEIAFADSMLHIYEIYNLPLSAELAVLSACQTAAGKIMRGEGIMSLARGFMYAGCPSVVSSLWSVNDEATTELMQAFYANLKAGQAKNQALQNAQKTVMQQKNNPYYWAAFVQIGDGKPIYKNNNCLCIAIFSLLALAFGIIFFFKRKKKTANFNLPFQ